VVIKDVGNSKTTIRRKKRNQTLDEEISQPDDRLQRFNYRRLSRTRLK